MTKTKTKKGQLSFHVEQEQYQNMFDCAQRAIKLAEKYDLVYNLQSAEMDLSACHANGQPLDFKKLLAFDDGNFGHDVFGIRRHLNRQTGHVEGFFLARCAKPSKFKA